MHPLIVLTGGPGGGKTTLINELRNDAAWRGRFVALPEAIFVALPVGISPQEPQFQRLMVNIQRNLEEAVLQTLEPTDSRFILCHRGTLDPLAYWLARGWAQADFFAQDSVSLENHYQRYQAVIHLVTAANGAETHYTRWPQAHRHETIEEAIHLDDLLGQVWGNHPRYYRLDNVGRDWASKSLLARDIITQETL